MEGRKFCKVLALALMYPDTEIWCLDVKDAPLLDVFGRPIPVPVEGADVFFLDYCPEANWSHPCGYCSLTDHGLLYHAAEWPPNDTIMRRL